MKSYKNVLKSNYIIIYIIYFSFFSFNGPLETSMPLLFEKIGLGERNYGYLLSIINILHVFLPGFVAYLANKINSSYIAILAMVLSLLGSIFLGFSSNIYMVFIFALLLYSGRTFFNFSFGNSVNYSMDNSDRGKYFALRDLFLFGSISIGLFAASYLTKIYGVQKIYSIFSFGFIIPIIFILIYRNKNKTIKIETEEEKNNSEINNKMLIKELFRDKLFWSFLLIEIGTIVYSTALSFLPLLGTSIGISVSKVMSIFGVVTIINSIIALILGHLSDLGGRKWLYVFDLAFDILPSIVFAFTQNIFLFSIGILLTMIKDALAPSSFAYFFDCFEEEKKGVFVQGLLSSIGNALSFIAPIIIGILWIESKKIVFIIGAFGTAFSAVIAALFLPNIINTEGNNK